MNHRPINTRADVLAADLHTLEIVSAGSTNFEADPVNIYVSNEDGDDVYIGELADSRLRNLVEIAPQLADALRGAPWGDEDQEALIEIANLLRTAFKL